MNDDLKHILSAITYASELDDLCLNTSLIKHILESCVFNKKDVDKFNIFIQENMYWCRGKSIFDVFRLIEFYEKHKWSDKTDDFVYKNEFDIDHELLELNELNKCMHIINIDEQSKKKLYAVIQNNQQTKDKLNLIAQSNTEENFSFEELLRYLTKPEKKNLLNI